MITGAKNPSLDTAGDRRSARGYRSRRAIRGRGFTLVELLVVIAIIVMLITLLLPVLGKFKSSAKTAKSQAIVNMIGTACGYYRNDFDDYPPSRDDVNYSGWRGGELIVLFLTGYAGDDGDDGTPAGTLDVDDGKETYGFRLMRRGKVYGPYNGLEKMALTKRPEDTTGYHPEFIDAFKRPILYYRYTGSYNDLDNDGPANLNTAYAVDAAGRYYRKDYLLISIGADDKWNAPREPASDDITNFFAD